jgi:hypothetical protein
MTTVGKIFVIINMVLSLVLSGLIVVWYAKSAPYAAKYAQAKDLVTVANTSAQTSTDQLQKANAEYKTELTRANDQLDKLRKDLISRDVVVAALQKKLSDQQKERAQHQEELRKFQTEAAAHQNDVEQLRVTLKAEQDSNLALLKAVDKARQDKVKADIERDAYKDKNQQLAGQMQKLAEDLARAGTPGRATAAGTESPNAPKPPAESMEGLVKSVDPSGLVKLSLGSDAGLQRGHTLEAYRLNATTQKYLGRVRILEVTPTESVAQPLGRMSSPLQPKDTVASRILGN